MLKKILHGMWRVIEVIIIIYVIFVTSCILFRNEYGYTQFDKYTFVSIDENATRYLDDVKEGQLLVVKSTLDINEGDKIYYYAVINEKYVIRSGVVASKTEDDYNIMYILDDEDKTTLSEKKVLGKLSDSYPKYGTFLNLLESKFGFLLLVLLPIMLIFVYQIYEFVVILKFEKVEDETNVKKTKEKKKEKTNEISEENSDETKEENSDEIKEENSDETKKENSDETKEKNSDETKEKNSDETKEENSDETKEENSDETKEKNSNETKEESSDTKEEKSNETKEEKE